MTDVTMIDPQWTPKIASQFRLQWEEAQNAFVLLYPEGMIKLNFSGGEILSRCNGSKSVFQIIQELAEKFPEAEDIEQDILAFFSTAYSRHWLLND